MLLLLSSAAFAYGLDNGAHQKVMVCDLGGGTFDVSIIKIGEGVIEVLATNGDNHLGGDDFDERITNHLVNVIKKEYHMDVRKNLTAYQRVKETAKQAKKELSCCEKSYITLPYLTQMRGNIINFEYTLTRMEFNDLIYDLVERTTIPVQNALMDAGIAVSKLDKVLLIGGTTRIPLVQEKERQLTVLMPSQNISPDECVALGAAIQADTLSAGVPQIEVIFDIDANGILKLSAKDLDAGKEQSIVITDNERMSDEEIEQAIRDAEQYLKQDFILREAIDIIYEANKCLNRAETALSKAKKELSKEERKQIKADIANLRKLITKTKQGKMMEMDISSIRNVINKLYLSSEKACSMAGMDTENNTERK